MTYLLDTHALLWSIGQSSLLSATVRDLIRDRTNEVMVSSASLWEISLKYGIGKLVLGSMAPDDIPGYCETLGFRILELDAGTASTYHTLPRIAEHRDPFDRMLAHQCIRLRAVLVTRDTRLACYEPYGLACAW
ncbi:MAG: type II toxin-antitoxin system VapC family toxin [Gammaproteobacteria bacterium]|nr:type II toxin-antitoxin system VapC family toxin [Gammaproteobacteria bacterium]